MSAQELRKRLHAVDPNLNIVSGGHHRNSRRDDGSWDKAAGIICTNCGKEVFRSRNGLCLPCWEKTNEVEIRDKTRITNWLPMAIIKQITHPARKE